MISPWAVLAGAAAAGGLALLLAELRPAHRTWARPWTGCTAPRNRTGAPTTTPPTPGTTGSANARCGCPACASRTRNSP
ncbi:hypothetical protein [Kitasatospora cheerisanensis]|uniref:hypothetical protein n=1 Tax=Kitasatospora cheerisanensis TaxID=81942 RepID=UPI001FCB4513|nr:hypothetical protein [Kitasatospora cheerisanensis]